MMLRLWLFLFCFTLVASAASSITTRGKSAPDLKQHWKTSDSYNVAYHLEPSSRNITTEAKDTQQM